MKKWIYIIFAIVGSIIMCSCQELLDEMNKSNGSSSSNNYNASNSASSKTDNAETKEENTQNEEDDDLLEKIIPIFEDADILDEEKLDLTSFKVGDVITLGKYEQDGDEENGKEAIEWIILKKDTDYALLVSKYALDCIEPFLETGPSKDGGKSRWNDSKIRTMLNKDFYSDSFDESEKKVILTAEVTTYDLNDRKFLTTKDNVFILSETDVTNESYGFHESWAKEGGLRVCRATKYATSKNRSGNKPYIDGVKYWLRTQDKTHKWDNGAKYKYDRYLSEMKYVRETGQIATDGAGAIAYYVRPACIVSIK